MIVRYAGERPDEKEFKLYVCMLSRQSTEAEVRALFEPFGPLTEVFLIRSREGNQSKGAAFVKFTNRDDAQRAIDAIHDKIKDKDAPGLVQVRFAHTKEERAAHLSHVLGSGMGNPMMHTGMASRNMGGGMGGYGQMGYGPMQYNAMGQPINKYNSGQPAGYNGMYQQPPPPPSAPPQHYGHPRPSGMGGDGAYNNMQPQPPPQSYSQYEQQNQYAPQQPYGMPPYQHSPQPKDVRGPDGANLFVYNVPEHYGEQDLNQLFANFGAVLSTRIQRDLTTGVSKGFGFVSYDDPQAAQNAIHALDGFTIGNKRLTVRIKTARESRNNFRAVY